MRQTREADEKLRNHQLVRLQAEITGPVPPGISTAVSVAVFYEFSDCWVVLASERGDVPIWEFAGGKLEPGENSRQAAVREIKEELGLEITDLHHACSYVVLRQDKSYLMQFYVAEIVPAVPLASAREVANIEYLDVRLPLPKDRRWWPATVAAWPDIQRELKKIIRCREEEP